MFTTVMTVQHVPISQVAFHVHVSLVLKVMDLSVMMKMNVLEKKTIALTLPHVVTSMVASSAIVKMDLKVMVSHALISMNAVMVLD